MDRDLGLKVFRSLHKWIGTYNPSFKLSFDDFLKEISKNNSVKLNIYLEGVGMGVRESGISDSRIESAMISLANASKGRVPANPLEIFQYLSGASGGITWRDTLDVVGYVVTESAGTFAKGAEEIGKSIITTGKLINWLLPAIGLFFVAYWVNRGTGGSLFRGLR